MILQALTDFYHRLDSEGRVAPPGFKRVEIPFLIVLDRKGNFAGLHDTRTPSGKKNVAQSFTVPAEHGRAGSKAWQVANLLWDHYGYVLGWPKSDSEKDRQLAKQQHCTFKAEIAKLREAIPGDSGGELVHRFIEQGDFAAVFNHPDWENCRKVPGCNLSFIVQGETRLVCQSEQVTSYVASASVPGSGEEESAGQESLMEGFCMVTGEYGQVARLHLRTPIPGAKSNAKIVSFQKNMGFDSYGKEQSYNAPTSVKAMFCYTTALNEMLAKNSRQKLLVGDATTVFWAEKENTIEDVFADIFGEPAKDNPEQATKSIRVLYEAPKAGTPPLTEDYTPFYVLGLAPNAARIAVRFWHAGTVADTARHIIQHFDDCAMVHGPKQPEHLSLFRLLVSTAMQGKSENIPPNLGGEFMKAILSGAPYPQTLLAAAIRRCRAEREITYPRATLIKAVLARAARFYQQPEKEVGMALDTGNTNIGYRLGRLFAVLEKIQEEASPGINATIRDRFYGAASGTPVAAFPHLMKLKNHHLGKLENRGRAVNLEKIITEVMGGISDFPTHLTLQDQGRFAVGYYHQRQDFFTKHESN